MNETNDHETPAAPRTRRRSLLPHFGLRSLFIFAIVFCLLCGWVGRNFVRMREEDAAIETLKQSGAAILLQGDDFRARHPATPADPGSPGGGGAVVAEEDWYGRLFGWAERLPIRHVNLQGQDPEDEKLHAALAALAVLPEIESVNLNGAGFDDASMPPLAKIAGLETVGLFSTGVTPDGLETLEPAKGLRRVNLFGGSADLATGLAPLRELRAVTLSGAPGDNVTGLHKAVETIAGLPHLEELTLMYLHQRDPELAMPVGRASKLRSLTIMSIVLTEAEIASLGELPTLESLRISNIDDAALARLGALPTLRKIELSPPVTAEAARRFSQSHPACRVEYALFRPDGVIFQAGEEVEPSATEDAAAR